MTGIIWKSSAIVLVLASLFALPAAAQMPQMFSEYGVGPRDMGLGNTGAAAASDFSAAYYNPAALVRAEGFAIDIGYKGIIPDLRLKVGRYPANKFTENIPATHSVIVGISWNIVVERLIDRKWTERFTFGMAVAQGAFFKSFSIYHDANIPYFFRYNDRCYNLMPIYFSLGVRILDWLSIGGGVVPAPADTTTHTDVNTNFELSPYTFTAEQGTITRAIGKLEPVLGVLFRIPAHGREAAAIGLTWHEEVSSTDGKGHAFNYTRVHLGDTTFNLGSIDTPVLTMTGWTPMQAVIGLAGWPLPGLTLSVDGIWRRWSRWRNFYELKPDPPLHDTYHVRAGIENLFQTGNGILPVVTMRGGGYWEPTPVAGQNGPSNLIDPNKTVLAGGWGLEFRDPQRRLKAPIRLEGTFQAQLLQKTVWQNQDDPKFGKISVWGAVYNVAATIGTEF